MEPRGVVPTDLAYWGELDPRPVTFTPPPGLAGGSACETVVTTEHAGPADGQFVVRVPWRPTAEDVAQMAAGGTVWLSQWGGLAPHAIEVQPVGPDPLVAEGTEVYLDAFDAEGSRAWRQPLRTVADPPATLGDVLVDGGERVARSALDPAPDPAAEL